MGIGNKRFETGSDSIENLITPHGDREHLRMTALNQQGGNSLPLMGIGNHFANGGIESISTDSLPLMGIGNLVGPSMG